MRKKMTVIVTCFTVISLLSCQTVEQNPGAATGAGVGAVAGGVAGALIGRGAGAVLLGGLLGALAGGAVGHYAYDVPRTREETARQYNYNASQGTILTIEDATIYPRSVYPGETVDLRVTYAVLTPSPEVEVNVTEIRRITHHGELVGNPEIRVIRPGGTYTSTVPLRLPPSASRGEYTVKIIIESPHASDAREAHFTVQ
jgi:uncharacterized protein YcfJ